MIWELNKCNISINLGEKIIAAENKEEHSSVLSTENSNVTLDFDLSLNFDERMIESVNDECNITVSITECVSEENSYVSNWKSRTKSRKWRHSYHTSTRF